MDEPEIKRKKEKAVFLQKLDELRIRVTTPTIVEEIEYCKEEFIQMDKRVKHMFEKYEYFKKVYYKALSNRKNDALSELPEHQLMDGYMGDIRDIFKFFSELQLFYQKYLIHAYSYCDDMEDMWKNEVKAKRLDVLDKPPKQDTELVIPEEREIALEDPKKEDEVLNPDIYAQKRKQFMELVAKYRNYRRMARYEVGQKEKQEELFQKAKECMAQIDAMTPDFPFLHTENGKLSLEGAFEFLTGDKFKVGI